MQSTMPLLAAVVTVVAALAGCAEDGARRATIQQAGSSTVLPLAEAWAEELAPRGIDVVVAGGGSGAGASKLCAAEIDVADMSRTMKPSEVADCRANGVEPVAWKVAYDGITVVVHKDNAFVDHLTVEELRHIWRADGPAQTWADVRQGWPAERIVAFGPDSDSGTYEFFNEEILGKDCGPAGDEVCGPRSDYTASPNDNVVVEGVSATAGAIGHFGFAYFLENEDKVKAVPVVPEDGDAPVEPSFDAIADGSYAPLARPLFMVTDGVPAAGTPLHAYLDHALGDGQALVREIGYVELDPASRDEQRGRL